MKKLFVSHLIALLLLILLVSNALAAPGTAGRQLPYCDTADLTTEQRYWSYYQNPPTTTAFTDLCAGQRYWSYYQNPPGTTAFADFSAGQRYWSYYQNPPASTIMLGITSK